MSLIDDADVRRRIIAFATGLHSAALPVDTVMMLLTQVPTIDAVPVVRCKDCARCVMYKGVPFCNKWRTFPEIKLDDFCSYGERKEGADNE